MRDESAMVVVKGVGSTRPAVRLFNAAGVETGHFLWDGGALVGWGWSDAQELVMVDAAAKVRGMTLLHGDKQSNEAHGFIKRGSL